MLQIFRRTLDHHLVLSNTDMVVAAAFLPAGGILNNLHVEVLAHATADRSILTSVVIGCSAFVVPLLDPDSAPTFDSVWDTQVPKDVEAASGALDLDTAASDPGPEFEVGEIDIVSLFEAGTEPVELKALRRRKLISFASVEQKAWAAATPDTWIPTWHLNMKSGRKVRVKHHSAIMFAISNPSLSDTTTTVWTVPSEAAISQLQYAGDTLKRAMIEAIGLTEAGAETPWTEALSVIADYIEPDAFEETAGAFTSPSWQCFTKATFDVSVPGTLEVTGPISSE